MRITLNGEQRDVPGSLTVLGLLQHLNILPERVAVEINEEIVRKAVYDDTPVRDGDRVEVVQFMGGGSLLRISHCGIRIEITARRGNQWKRSRS